MAPADAKAAKGQSPTPIEFFQDVTMRVTVEFARAQMTIAALLRLKKGSIMELDKMAGEPLDIRLNGRLVARGEAVIVNDRFGVRVTEIVSSEDMTESVGGDDSK
jgi:flagellar motor switch protein FliN/FliY